MNLGIDIGYSAVKAVSGERRVTFPSAVGTPDKARFSLNGGDATIILMAPAHVQVGEGAIQQSRFIQRREERRWIESDEWYTLFLAALTELSTTPYDAAVRIVTGLPVAFFSDKDTVQKRLTGEHTAQREGRHSQRFNVVSATVIPQPFGTLLTASLDNRGRIVDQTIAGGAIGVIDCGGKTTNLLSVNRLTEISHETASVNVGAWDAVRAMRGWFDEHCPDLDLRDHQVIERIIARSTKYYGKEVDLSEAVDAILKPLAGEVLAAATQMWNGAAALDAILVSGGGALLLGPYIGEYFPHARVVQEAVFANAVGFWKFAERLANQ